MTQLAELIREEIRKEDILAPIKETLIKNICEQMKKHGKASIRWEYYDARDLETSDYCISLVNRDERELPLKMWLAEQGFEYRNVYHERTGGLWGISVSVPVR